MTNLLRALQRQLPHCTDAELMEAIETVQLHRPDLTVQSAGTFLVNRQYQAAKAAGWHNSKRTGLPKTPEEIDDNFPQAMALAHSELSEALTGHRSSLMDDKLPHRLMAEVELADAVLRICDTAGAMGYDLGGAMAEKMAYNAIRPDHTLKERSKSTGKKY